MPRVTNERVVMDGGGKGAEQGPGVGDGEVRRWERAMRWRESAGMGEQETIAKRDPACGFAGTERAAAFPKFSAMS